MRIQRFGYLVPLWTALACGGVAQQSPAAAGGSSLGSGGNESGAAGIVGIGAASGASNALPGGNGGSVDLYVPFAGAGGALPDTRDGNACGFDPPSCRVVDQFIDLDNVARMRYPLDTSCGYCNVKCEVCDELTCSLWGQARTGCDTFHLQLAACAGPAGEPPCVNTAATTPYYVDASGKRWRASLTGRESQLPELMLNGPIGVDLTLTIDDGVTTQTIGARAQLCASFNYSLGICN